MRLTWSVEKKQNWVTVNISGFFHLCGRRFSMSRIYFAKVCCKHCLNTQTVSERVQMQCLMKYGSSNFNNFMQFFKSRSPNSHAGSNCCGKRSHVLHFVKGNFVCRLLLIRACEMLLDEQLWL